VPDVLGNWRRAIGGHRRAETRATASRIGLGTLTNCGTGKTTVEISAALLKALKLTTARDHQWLRDVMKEVASLVRWRNLDATAVATRTFLAVTAYDAQRVAIVAPRVWAGERCAGILKRAGTRPQRRRVMYTLAARARDGMLCLMSHAGAGPTGEQEVPMKHPATTSAGLVPTAVTYPDSDGQPMGETAVHVEATYDLIHGLRCHLQLRHNVLTTGNVLLYYEEGDPTSVVVPDVMVIKGLTAKLLGTYKLWEQGVVPCVVVELTSKSSRLADIGTKRALYAMLGVAEYVVFDPLGEYLRPRIRAFRLQDGDLVPLPVSESDGFASDELGCILRPDGDRLRVVDSGSGEVAPTRAESLQRAVEAREQAAALAARAEAAAARADEAEQRLAELSAEIVALRGRT